jgi:hypothetical protein
MVVPASPDHIVTGAEPYLLTRGLERTEKTAKDSDANTTSKGPTIELFEFKSKLGKERIKAPPIPSRRARANLPLIFSLRNNADRTAMKTGPKEIRNPDIPEETVVSAKFSDK